MSDRQLGGLPPLKKIMIGNKEEFSGGLSLADTVVAETSFGLTAAAGTSTLASRSDHTHGTPINPITGLTAKAFLYTNAAGTITATVAASNGELLIGSTGNIPVKATLTGTANQITVTNGAGTITLSTPQNIHTAASPTFAGLTLTSALTVPNGGSGVATLTSNGVLYGNGTGAIQVTAQGGSRTMLVANAGAPSFTNAPHIGDGTVAAQFIMDGSAGGGSGYNLYQAGGLKASFQIASPDTYLDYSGSLNIRSGAGGGGNALIATSSNNVGIGSVSSFGTNAVGVFAVANGTAPTTGPADTVQFYSSDNSAGNTVPSFYCEGTEVLATGQADSVSSVRVKMRINGTVVTLLAI